MDETPDEALTGLLDGELPEPERIALVARLHEDVALQRRLDALARARAPLDDAFAGLLAQAPAARLRAALPARKAPARLRLAASLVAALLLGAALALALSGGRQDWTSAVVDYMALYTPETFAGLRPDAAQEAAIVKGVGARLGAPQLTPDGLDLPALSFKTGFVLAFDGAPLGEFAFADASGAPYLFCVIAKSATPAPVSYETRRGYALALWASRDHRFLVIGPSPQLVRDWSRKLSGGV